MKIFSVKKYEKQKQSDLNYMSIGFVQKPTPHPDLVDCYGAALVLLDGKNGYWFNYYFRHSLDWSILTDLELEPLKQYMLSVDQLSALGTEIVCYIADFISQEN